jgi:hypothetical protein
MLSLNFLANRHILTYLIRNEILLELGIVRVPVRTKTKLHNPLGVCYFTRERDTDASVVPSPNGDLASHERQHCRHFAPPTDEGAGRTE